MKELTYTLKKKKTEYIQNQINKIRDSVDDGQSRIEWQRVNEVSRRKSTARLKLNAVSQEEQIHPWNNISRIYLDNLRKLQMSLSQRILAIN